MDKTLAWLWVPWTTGMTGHSWLRTVNNAGWDPQTRIRDWNQNSCARENMAQVAMGSGKDLESACKIRSDLHSKWRDRYGSPLHTLTPITIPEFQLGTGWAFQEKRDQCSAPRKEQAVTRTVFPKLSSQSNASPFRMAAARLREPHNSSHFLTADPPSQFELHPKSNLLSRSAKPLRAIEVPDNDISTPLLRRERPQDTCRRMAHRWQKQQRRKASPGAGWRNTTLLLR